MKKAILSFLVICLFFTLTGCTENTNYQVQWESSKFDGDILKVGISENIQSIAIYTKSKCLAIDSQSTDGQAVLNYVNDILTAKNSFNGVTDGAFSIDRVGKPLDYLPYEIPYLVIFLNAPQEYTISGTDLEGYQFLMIQDVYAISFDLRSLEVCFLDNDYATYDYSFLDSYGLRSSSSSQELADLIKEILSR